MDRNEFLTMRPERRVQEINNLLQKYDLSEICNLIGISSSSFSKIMREGDYFYHKADRKYYPFVRSEEERTKRNQNHKSDELIFLKQNISTLKKIVENYENNAILILDKRIYRKGAQFSNKSIRMNNEIYEEFIKFCDKYYNHLKIQHVIAQALIDAMEKYKPSNE